MVEGPGCKVKGEKMKPKVKGQEVLSVNGNALKKYKPRCSSSEKDAKSKKNGDHPIFMTPFHEMIGKEISDVQTLGKELFIFFLDFDQCLRLHFLMAGGFRLNGNRVDSEGGGEADTASLELQLSKDLLRFNKSAAEMRPATETVERIENMKTLDICKDCFSHKRAVELIIKQNGRLVCDVLLDQDILPGVGNIIKNEGLFDSGIDPNTRIEVLSETHISHLVKMTRDFSLIFYKCRLTGKPLQPYMKIYRKGKCKQCGDKVVNTRMGESSVRLTCFCPTCQTNDLGKLKNRKLSSKNSLLAWVESTKGNSEEVNMRQQNWSCHVCTLLNKYNRSSCSACFTTRQGNDSGHGNVETESPSNSEGKPCQFVPCKTAKLIKSENETPLNSTGMYSNVGLVATKFASPVLRERKIHRMMPSPDGYTGGMQKHAPEDDEPSLFQAGSHLPCGLRTQSKLSQNTTFSAVKSEPLNIKQSSHPIGTKDIIQVDPPICAKHKRKSIMREVRKKGDNLGRFFYSCPMSRGTCNFFIWADEKFPFCTQHNRRTTIRTVMKQGSNNGRKFFACSAGKKDQCGFFEWADQYKNTTIR